MKKRGKYPGIDQVERQKDQEAVMGKVEQMMDEEPDFIGGKPNYDKFEKMGWDTEKVLVWLNID